MDSRRPNKRFVAKYLIYSMSFGLLMGAVFPFYAGMFADFGTGANRLRFVAGCLAAGIFVGLASYLIARWKVLRVIDDISRRIAEMAEGEGSLGNAIPLYSNDSIGRLIVNFNSLQSKLCGMVGGLDTTNPMRLPCYRA